MAAASAYKQAHDQAAKWAEKRANKWPNQHANKQTQAKAPSRTPGHTWPRLAGMAAMVVLLTSGSLAAHAAKPAAPLLDENTTASVELPLLSGWYDGDVVFYLTTDVSQQEMARAAGANYVPRLKHALRPPEPGQPSALDRVYKFTNFTQGSVFPSAPHAVGATGATGADGTAHGADADADADYTPFWVVYQVTWLPGATPHLLRSEQEISDAEQHGQVRIEATKVVVNCPILFSRKSGPPGNITVHVLGQAQPAAK